MIKITELKNKLLLTVIYGCILLLFWALKLPCFFQYFFGIPCPGCGMSHAVFCILQLDFMQAFSCHPMVFSMPILYGYFIIDFRSLRRQRLHKGILAIIALGFLINWIVGLC